jgi:glycosyltransferase involved in cell wall biosynthesis
MSKKLDLEIFKKKELEIMKRADKVIVVSPEEHQLLTNDYEILNCSVLWKYLDRSELAIETKVDLPPKSTSVILFVGSFNHTPNYDGIEWFSREVLPDLRATAGKSFEVQVVGGGMSPEKQEFLESQGIRVLGWVQDLAPIYESADVVIAPIRYGAGLKGKVLEAAKFGKPIVATDIAMEGFTLTPGEDYISANSANEFVQGTRDLIENPQRAKSMGSKIQSEMSKAFSKEKFTSELDACILEVLTEPTSFRAKSNSEARILKKMTS